MARRHMCLTLTSRSAQLHLRLLAAGGVDQPELRENMAQIYGAARSGVPSTSVAERVDESLPMRLENSLVEKKSWADIAELYSLLQATEHLESAFISDAITAEQYNAQCNKFLGQFQMLEETLRGTIESVESFMTRFNIRLPQAHKRLVVDRVPATAMNKTSHAGNEGALIFETCCCLVTAVDVLKLGEKSIDAITPNISAVCVNLNKNTSLPATFPPLVKLQNWLKSLSSRPASAQLSDDEVRQLSFDVDQALSTFHDLLDSNRGK